MIGAPKIVGSRTNTDLSVTEHQPVTLSCQVSGVPEPSIVWTHDGSVVDEDDRVKLLRGGRQLQVTSSHVSDAGIYVCAVQNIAGSDQKQYRLSVLGSYLSDILSKALVRR